MTQLEIDVSGSDILSKDYTVVIAEKYNKIFFLNLEKKDSIITNQKKDKHIFEFGFIA